MSWIADAHREWHYVHGQVTCPLDCGIGEVQDDSYDPEPMTTEEQEREARELAAWRAIQEQEVFPF